MMAAPKKFNVGAVDDELATIHRHIRTLCHLSEMAQKSVIAAKRMKMLGDFDMFDELVVEQAYLVKQLVEGLRKSIDDAVEEAAR